MVESQFLSEILSSFGNAPLPPITIKILIFVGLALVVTLIVSRYLTFLKNRAISNRIPTGWVKDSGAILKILDNASVNRSKISLSIHSDTHKRRTIPCSIVSIGKNVVLEISNLNKLTPKWIGRKVDIYFHVMYTKTKQPIFYHFISDIVNVTPSGKSFTNIHLAVPDHLEQAQKREFLRVSPPSKYYDYLNLMPYTKENSVKAINFLTTDKNITPAFYGGLFKNMQLKDISGGGVALDVPRISSQDFNSRQLTKGKNLILLLSIIDSNGRGVIRYALIVQVRRMYYDLNQQKIQMGLSFEAQLDIDQNHKNKHKWISLSGKGSTEIDDWAYNLHLELYREGNEEM